MNPERSLAPALFAVEPLQYLWIYVIGPVGGALLAGLNGRLIRGTSRSGI
ncbi:MAG: aquaporin [Gammaproteobacteria bacterium]|nr:aquaporin [Gammaproteobacteria bacterium]